MNQADVLGLAKAEKLYFLQFSFRAPGEGAGHEMCRMGEGEAGWSRAWPSFSSSPYESGATSLRDILPFAMQPDFANPEHLP
eukprot:1148745-Pelagomonas_calceolata.AAC.1